MTTLHTCDRSMLVLPASGSAMIQAPSYAWKGARRCWIVISKVKSQIADFQCKSTNLMPSRCLVTSVSREHRRNQWILQWLIPIVKKLSSWPHGLRHISTQASAYKRRSQKKLKRRRLKPHPRPDKKFSCAQTIPLLTRDNLAATSCKLSHTLATHIFT